MDLDPGLLGAHVEGPFLAPARRGAHDPDLLRHPEGVITEAGLRNNLYVSVRYLAAWLQGRGAVPIHHLMEDAATAEISRSQIWQWIRHPRGVLDDGGRIDLVLVRRLLAEEQARIRSELGGPAYADGPYALAGELLDRVVAAEELEEFLTLVAYDYLN